MRKRNNETAQKGLHMENKPQLTLETLLQEAVHFVEAEQIANEPQLYGVTDGKAVGTYIEHKFTMHLSERFVFGKGNSASGLDFPELGVDLKVTNIKQPQSSCPYKTARQKIYGLGYHLIVFVYDKQDDHASRTSQLQIMHTLFIDKFKTADYQTTLGICTILDNNGNEEDLISFLSDRNLPIDEIEAANIAAELLINRPETGYLTISNALQWRLQYGRVIELAGSISGILRIT